MNNKVILKIENLTKTYKDVKVLDNINITLEEGRIYGLIGLNGAGKTTLMKTIAGFVNPQEGNIELFGKSGEKELKKERKRLGCMIDSQGIYDDMTAEENLNLHRILRGIPNKEIVDELIEDLELTEVRNKKVRKYSLGMKQRLNIAVALISNPEFLVLDEPINALDPKAIVKFRKMIKKLVLEKHITIFISSHILSELYETASNYIIIHKGEIKEELTSEELETKCRKHILLKTTEPERMVYIIENLLDTRNYTVMPDKSIKLYDFLDDKEHIAKTFMNEKLIVTNLSEQEDSLEDYFMKVVGGREDV